MMTSISYFPASVLLLLLLLLLLVLQPAAAQNATNTTTAAPTPPPTTTTTTTAIPAAAQIVVPTLEATPVAIAKLDQSFDTAAREAAAPNDATSAGYRVWAGPTALTSGISQFWPPSPPSDEELSTPRLFCFAPNANTAAVPATTTSSSSSVFFDSVRTFACRDGPVRFGGASKGADGIPHDSCGAGASGTSPEILDWGASAAVNRTMSSGGGCSPWRFAPVAGTFADWADWAGADTIAAGWSVTVALRAGNRTRGTAFAAVDGWTRTASNTNLVTEALDAVLSEYVAKNLSKTSVDDSEAKFVPWPLRGTYEVYYALYVDARESTLLLVSSTAAASFGSTDNTEKKKTGLQVLRFVAPKELFDGSWHSVAFVAQKTEGAFSTVRLFVDASTQYGSLDYQRCVTDLSTVVRPVRSKPDKSLVSSTAGGETVFEGGTLSALVGAAPPAIFDLQFHTAPLRAVELASRGGNYLMTRLEIAGELALCVGCLLVLTALGVFVGAAWQLWSEALDQGNKQELESGDFGVAIDGATEGGAKLATGSAKKLQKFVATSGGMAGGAMKFQLVRRLTSVVAPLLAVFQSLALLFRGFTFPPIFVKPLSYVTFIFSFQLTLPDLGFQVPSWGPMALLGSIALVGIIIVLVFGYRDEKQFTETLKTYELLINASKELATEVLMHFANEKEQQQQQQQQQQDAVAVANSPSPSSKKKKMSDAQARSGGTAIATNGWVLDAGTLCALVPEVSRVEAARVLRELGPRPRTPVEAVVRRVLLSSRGKTPPVALACDVASLIVSAAEPHDVTKVEDVESCFRKGGLSCTTAEAVLVLRGLQHLASTPSKVDGAPADSSAREGKSSGNMRDGDETELLERLLELNQSPKSQADGDAQALSKTAVQRLFLSCEVMKAVAGGASEGPTRDSEKLHKEHLNHLRENLSIVLSPISASSERTVVTWANGGFLDLMKAVDNFANFDSSSSVPELQVATFKDNDTTVKGQLKRSTIFNAVVRRPRAGREAVAVDEANAAADEAGGVRQNVNARRAKELLDNATADERTAGERFGSKKKSGGGGGSNNSSQNNNNNNNAVDVGETAQNLVLEVSLSPGAGAPRTALALTFWLRAPQHCPVHNARLMEAGPELYELQTDAKEKVVKCCWDGHAGVKMSRGLPPCRVDRLFVCSEDEECSYARCFSCMAPTAVEKRAISWFSSYIGLKRNPSALISLVSFLCLQSIYLPITQNAMFILACHPQLRCEFPVCDLSDSAFFEAAIIAIVSVLLVTIGLPVYWGLMVRRRKRQVNAVCRESPTMWEELLENDETSLANLYNKFEFDFMAMDVFLMLSRTVALVMCVAFTEPESVAQLLSVAIVTLANALYLGFAAPYIDAWLDVLGKLDNMHACGTFGLLAFDHAARTFLPGTDVLGGPMLLVSIVFFGCYLFIFWKTIFTPFFEFRAASRAANLDREEQMWLQDDNVERRNIKLRDVLKRKQAFFGADSLQCALTEAHILAATRLAEDRAAMRRQVHSTLLRCLERERNEFRSGAASPGGPVLAQYSFRFSSWHNWSQGRGLLALGEALRGDNVPDALLKSLFSWFDKSADKKGGNKNKRKQDDAADDDNDDESVGSSGAEVNAMTNAFSLLVSMRKPVVGVDLSGKNLTGVMAQGAELRHCNLQGANLMGVDMTGGIFVHCNLKNAFLSDAKFGPKQSEPVQSTWSSTVFRHKFGEKAPTVDPDARQLHLSASAGATGLLAVSGFAMPYFVVLSAASGHLHSVSEPVGPADKCSIRLASFMPAAADTGSELTLIAVEKNESSRHSGWSRIHRYKLSQSTKIIKLEKSVIMETDDVNGLEWDPSGRSFAIRSDLSEIRVICAATLSIKWQRKEKSLMDDWPFFAGGLFLSDDVQKRIGGATVPHDEVFLCPGDYFGEGANQGVDLFVMRMVQRGAPAALVSAVHKENDERLLRAKDAKEKRRWKREDTDDPCQLLCQLEVAERLLFVLADGTLLAHYSSETNKVMIRALPDADKGALLARKLEHGVASVKGGGKVSVEAANVLDKARHKFKVSGAADSWELTSTEDKNIKRGLLATIGNVNSDSKFFAMPDGVSILIVHFEGVVGTATLYSALTGRKLASQHLSAKPPQGFWQAKNKVTVGAVELDSSGRYLYISILATSALSQADQKHQKSGTKTGVYTLKFLLNLVQAQSERAIIKNIAQNVNFPLFLPPRPQGSNNNNSSSDSNNNNNNPHLLVSYSDFQLRLVDVGSGGNVSEIADTATAVAFDFMAVGGNCAICAEGSHAEVIQVRTPANNPDDKQNLMQSGTNKKTVVNTKISWAGSDFEWDYIQSVASCPGNNSSNNPRPVFAIGLYDEYLDVLLVRYDPKDKEVDVIDVLRSDKKRKRKQREERVAEKKKNLESSSSSDSSDGDYDGHDEVFFLEKSSSDDAVIVTVDEKGVTGIWTKGSHPCHAAELAKIGAGDAQAQKRFQREWRVEESNMLLKVKLSAGAQTTTKSSSTSKPDPAVAVLRQSKFVVISHKGAECIVAYPFAAFLPGVEEVERFRPAAQLPSAGIRTLCASADESTLVTSCAAQTVVYDVKVLTGSHGSGQSVLQLIPRVVIDAQATRPAFLRDVANGTDERGGAMSLSGDGALLAVRGGKSQLKLWNVAREPGGAPQGGAADVEALKAFEAQTSETLPAGQVARPLPKGRAVPTAIFGTEKHGWVIARGDPSDAAAEPVAARDWVRAMDMSSLVTENAESSNSNKVAVEPASAVFRRLQTSYALTRYLDHCVLQSAAEVCTPPTHNAIDHEALDILKEIYKLNLRFPPVAKPPKEGQAIEGNLLDKSGAAPSSSDSDDDPYSNKSSSDASSSSVSQKTMSDWDANSDDSDFPAPPPKKAPAPAANSCAAPAAAAASTAAALGSSLSALKESLTTAVSAGGAGGASSASPAAASPPAAAASAPAPTPAPKSAPAPKKSGGGISKPTKSDFSSDDDDSDFSDDFSSLGGGNDDDDSDFEL